MLDEAHSYHEFVDADAESEWADTLRPSQGLHDAPRRMLRKPAARGRPADRRVGRPVGSTPPAASVV
jgi:hypothetical protein